MKIGNSMRADWLDRSDGLRYLKQIGVDCVNIVMSSVPSYGATGRITREGLTQCVDAVGDAGLAHRTHQQTGQLHWRPFWAARVRSASWTISYSMQR